MSQPLIKLNNGRTIPQLGLGVFRSEPGGETAFAVASAIEAGYRHIDTAAGYRNERDVAQGIKDSGISRKEIFVTSKLSTESIQQKAGVEGTKRSLELLGGQIDLYLIHWPITNFVEGYEAIQRFYEDKLLGGIGVSNFEIHHLKALEEKGLVTPAVNQIELHPKFQQKDVKPYCESKGIFIEAWSPLGGQNNLLVNDETILKIAQKHQKTGAQVLIRWHLQAGNIVIPKSVKKNRIEENFGVFDFELDGGDLQAIAALDTGSRLYGSPTRWDS
jgi:2,5-diketo-D-gluconate reductase A